MDALELLKADHDTVRQLFRDFEAAQESGDTDRMGQVQQQIFTELEVHTSIEEEVFYPAAEDAGEEAEELVKEGVEEHHVVDVLMGEIRALQPSDETFAPKMTVLIENVEHHAEEEETELFPQLREVFGNERLATIGEELEAAKQRHLAGGGSSGGGSSSGESSGDASKAELYEQAKEMDVEGRSSMTKEELAEAVGED
jgi:hemerythrin superfamily protein